MNFLNLFKRLLPDSRAWSLIVDKLLRKFFESLSISLGDDVKLYYDQIYQDLFPATTRELQAWNLQFGLPDNGLSEGDQRTRLAAAWQAQGGQSPRYIQDTLQNAGFPVYVHEWWVPGSDPPIVRNPFAVIQALGIGCGEPSAECGEPIMECGNSFFAGGGYTLVNKIYRAVRISLAECGDVGSECGEPIMGCGNFAGYRFERQVYELPTDPDLWPYFVYIGGETFGEVAQIPASRIEEFEDLCLKIVPEHLWIILKIILTGTWLQTDQSTTPGLVEIEFLINSSVTISWGDGSSDVLSGDTTAAHTYTTTGIFSITVDGDLDGVKEIEFTTGKETISGDIVNFLQFTTLEKLQASDTHISGNISVLSNTSTLEYIYLDRTLVFGNVGALNVLSSLTRLLAGYTNVSGSLNDFSGMTQLTQLGLNQTGMVGGLDQLSALTGLTLLGLGSTGVTGLISSITGNTGMQYLYLYTTVVSGDISLLIGLPLIHLHLYESSVTGDIEDLDTITTLVQLLAYDTAIAGDVGTISTLTNLVELDLHTTSVTGDIGDLNTLVNALLFGLYDLSVIFGAPELYPPLPAWSNADVFVYDNNLNSESVDAFIIALDNAGGTNGVLNIAGNNESRTGDSSEEVDSLVGKGWTVIVNLSAPAFVQTDQTGGAGEVEIWLSLPVGKQVTILWDDGDETIANGTGSPILYDHTYTSDLIFNIGLSGDYFDITHIEFAGGKETIFNNVSVFQSYIALEYLGADNTLISGNISGLIGLLSLETIFLNASSVSGDIGGISTLPSLTSVNFNTTAVSGNISGIAAETQYTRLDLGFSSVTGTITSLSALTALTYLDITDTAIVGNVSALAPLTALQKLYFDTTSISGDIGEFDVMTGMIELNAKDTLVSGAFDDLITLTVATLMNFEATDITYTTATLPTWSNLDLNLTSAGLSSSEVDQILIDFNTAGGINGTLRLAGTNQPRSSASDVAYTALLGNGWTIFVNEAFEFLDANHGPESSVTMRIEMPVGKSMHILWGDGNSTLYNGTGSPDTIIHPYTLASLDTISVSGDLDDVEEIGFENDSQIEGDISGFDLFANLERLYATDTNVDGNISGISSLTSLTQIWADDTSVTGATTSLSLMTSLTHVHFDNVPLTGSISVFSSMSGLVDLWMNGSSVTDSISNLASLTSLEDIGLDETSVSGALSNLSSLTSLIKIQLGNTSCTGDIGVFDAVLTLTHMHLYEQPFTGNLTDVADLDDLVDLRLNDSSVTGNASAIQDKLSLTYLDLSNLSVSGSTASFDDLTLLATFNLENTSVTGSVNEFNTLTVISSMNVSDNSFSISTFGSLPAWSNATLDFSSVGFFTFDVDDFLEQLDDAGGTNGYLDIAGTNDEPSPFGEEFKDNLEAKGWTVITNV
jgi:hypothetical protein